MSQAEDIENEYVVEAILMLGFPYKCTRCNKIHRRIYGRKIYFAHGKHMDLRAALEMHSRRRSEIMSMAEAIREIEREAS